MFSCFALICVLVCLFFICDSEFVWNPVKIGGGGYVIGVAQSPNGTLYSRTDVGSIYRFEEQSFWKPLLDNTPIQNQNLFGTDAFVISPYYDDVIYIASGMYEFDSPSYILKSIDGGETFKATNGFNNNQRIIIGGNEEFRWSRSRFCIHPDPNKNKIAGNETMYYGTRSQSLLYTENGGDNWSVISSFPFKNSTTLRGYHGYHIGILFVNINPFNYNIYVSLYNFGIYYSSDDAKTWNIIEKSTPNGFNLTSCFNSRFNPKYDNNLIYFSCSNGVFEYNETSKSLTNITPYNNSQYAGLDISENGEIMITAAFLPKYPTKIFWVNLTNNDYKWSQISSKNVDYFLPWSNSYLSHATALNCDNRYNDCRKIEIGDFYQVWFNDNIFNDNSTWYAKENGHEEVFVFIFTTPTSGASLFSGTSDSVGFRHVNVTIYPEYQIANGTFSQSLMGMDFCESNPNIMVAVAGGEGYNDMNHTGIYSTDNGVSWTVFGSSPPGYIYHNPDNGETEIYYGGKIYINPTNCSNIVWVPLNDVPYVSYNMGISWIKSTGAPVNTSGTLQAWLSNGEWNFAYPMYVMNDRINGNYVYIYHYETNLFYLSKDGGFSWFNTNVKLPGVKNSDGNQNGNSLYGKDYAFQGGYLSSNFGMEGNVCICFGFNGLYCSMDYGTTFDKVNGIYIARMVTFGIKSQKNKKQSVMYLFGLTDDDHNKGIDEGMYIINNSSMIRMNNNSYQLGDHSMVIMADRQTYGRVYIGSQGRGIYYSSYVN